MALPSVYFTAGCESRFLVWLLAIAVMDRSYMDSAAFVGAGHASDAIFVGVWLWPVAINCHACDAAW